VGEFGGEVTVWSRSFTWFLRHIFDNFKHLVIGGMEHFVDLFPTFAASIRRKIVSKGAGHMANNPLFRVIGFIDNTIFATCRPGSGPVNRGEGAPRWTSLIQVISCCC
jgi:hypothetical protein